MLVSKKQPSGKTAVFDPTSKSSLSSKDVEKQSHKHSKKPDYEKHLASREDTNKSQKEIWKTKNDEARKNWDSWNAKRKIQFHNETSLPTKETYHAIIKGKDYGVLPVRIGGDGNGNGMYRSVSLPDGTSINLDVSVRPKFANCWKCKKKYNAHESDGSCPHCGIDI